MSGYATAAAIVAAAASAYGQYQTGKQQEAFGKYQSQQAQADANAEIGAAQVRADKIRKMARIQAGQATAALAGSGVDVNEGTALNINSQIYQDAEEDSVTAIFDGSARSNTLQAQGQGYKIAGQQAAQAGMIAAGSTLLSAGGDQYSAWKKSQTNKTTG
jgi:hypothetical protein